MSQSSAAPPHVYVADVSSDQQINLGEQNGAAVRISGKLRSSSELGSAGADSEDEILRPWPAHEDDARRSGVREDVRPAADFNFGRTPRDPKFPLPTRLSRASLAVLHSVDRLPPLVYPKAGKKRAMLALRRLRVAARPLVRTNATLQSTLASSPSPPPPPTNAKPADAESTSTATVDASEGKNTRGRHKRSYPTRRPHIDLEHPREWRRALAPGVLPAYDEALRVIYADAKAVQKEAQEVREKLEKGELKGEEAEKERKRLDVLDVMGEVNLPEVRWKAANGMADLNKPVYRHLVEKRWREDGALDLLMERVYQMQVIPDLIPELHPSLDLRVNFPEPPPESLYLRTRVKRKYAAVEPGTYLLNEQTRKPPRLYTTVFHTDPRLYTLLMVDPDVPDEENASFTTYLHWLQCVTPFSVRLCADDALLPDLMSHCRRRRPPSTSPRPTHPTSRPTPPAGTPYHRYVLLVLPQSSPTERITVPTGIERLGFDVRKFVEEYGLRVNGGGVHIWRAVWDEDSSKVWNDVLKLPEPRYGFAPKPDPYAEVKSKPKYV
ncbi:hypothetical protein EVG20_g10831 [Dentipellis fragilis]|uniref:PEBP-like protein n=1 Tax=Dentipellis fragilis TaxID=205917 RepID=A0A4Y9XNV3_9AGAM|nr:hypothetical protein EVG20_g10831 [Dentipellis fragilis]